MPAETNFTQVAAINITMRSCRELKCASICENYIKENHLCIGYYVIPFSNVEVCMCALLVTHGNGVTVPLDGKVYVNSGKHRMFLHFLAQSTTRLLVIHSRIFFGDILIINLPSIIHQ